MKEFRADLHVHTVLSPCAEIEMLPPLIVSEAKVRGIDLIAITDHNASANISAVQKEFMNRNIQVENFQQFLVNFKSLIFDSARRFPFTRPAYVKSKYCPITSTGFSSNHKVSTVSAMALPIVVMISSNNIKLPFVT